MNAQTTSLPELRRLIGQRVLHRGIRCRIIEVLEDGPSLVLADGECNMDIQDNRFGEPNRMVPRTYTIPVRAGTEFHPDFLELTVARCN